MRSFRLDADEWEALRSTNWLAMRVTTGALFVWILISIPIDVFVYAPAGERYYLYLDLVILPIMAGLFLSMSRTTSTTAWRILMPIVLTSFVSWTGVLAGFQETPYTYFIVVLLLGGVFAVGPVAAIAIFASGPVAYAVTNALRTGSVTPDGPTILIEIAGASFAAWIVSRVLYRARLATVRAHTRLESLAARQAHEIDRQTNELRAANESLSQRLSEREVLLREIHHRVKNNLQILRSLFHLSEEHPSGGGMKATVESAERRIQAMAMVHQRLYEADDLESVELADYIHDLATYVVASYDATGHIALDTELASCRASIDLALNLGLILNEAVSNAVIHGLADPQKTDARITVRLTRNDDQLVVTVRDNGGGMDPKTPHEGLGLMLMETLSRQLRAEFTTTNGAGTEIRVVVAPERALLTPPTADEF